MNTFVKISQTNAFLTFLCDLHYRHKALAENRFLVKKFKEFPVIAQSNIRTAINTPV